MYIYYKEKRYSSYILVTGCAKPVLVDLSTNAIEQQAFHWKELGLKLGLEEHQIANISKKNETCQSKQMEMCCKEMFEKWLQVDPLATWDKLHDAVKSLTITLLSPGLRGMSLSK